MIAIVNYGSGNIKAVANIYKRLNVPTIVAMTADDLVNADKIVLPGVGAFDRAMERLEESGLRKPLDRMVLDEGTPVLGICVGMQVMAERSDEGSREGLGWIKGEVRRFDVSAFAQQTHLPHMGWNTMKPVEAHPLFDGLGEEARFYFLHSFYFSPDSQDNVLAMTDYGAAFASGVRSKNILGVQFHPEKSHGWGIRILENFAAIRSC